MSSAAKFAITLSAIIVLFYSALAVMSGFMDFNMLCLLGMGFIVMTIFFWLAYIVGRVLWRTEKRIWQWMNEKERKI